MVKWVQVSAWRLSSSSLPCTHAPACLACLPLLAPAAPALAPAPAPVPAAAANPTCPEPAVAACSSTGSMSGALCALPSTCNQLCHIARSLAHLHDTATASSRRWCVVSTPTSCNKRNNAFPQTHLVQKWARRQSAVSSHNSTHWQPRCLFGHLAKLSRKHDHMTLRFFTSSAAHNTTNGADVNGGTCQISPSGGGSASERKCDIIASGKTTSEDNVGKRDSLTIRQAQYLFPSARHIVNICHYPRQSSTLLCSSSQASAQSSLRSACPSLIASRLSGLRVR